MVAFKDLISRELAVGDSVATIAKGYRAMVIARVVKFTPKQVRVGYINNWNYGNGGQYEELLTYPEELVKIDGPDLTMHLLQLQS